MENTKSTAYALMILVAGFGVLAHYGRASAQAAPPAQYGSSYAPMQQAPAYAPMQQAPVQAQYGLVQTAVLAVAQMDGNGGFGMPAPLPVFQIVQLQPVAAAAAHHAAQHAPQGAAVQPSERQSSDVATQVPQGMSVTTPTAVVCNINGVQALTQSSDACSAAGGQPAL